MPKVTFYTHVSQPTVFCSKLIARAIRDGGRLLVWSDSDSDITRLNRDLWQAVPNSFLPHEIWLAPDEMPSETPVLLSYGTDLPTLPSDIIVLNLSPDFWSQAKSPPQRVLEIVGTSLEELADARERFKAYRSKGFEIEHHSREGKD